VEPEETAVARQPLGKHVPGATNAHSTIKELLDAVFSMRSEWYQILNIWLTSKVQEHIFGITLFSLLSLF
jgi:hypothetical protein